MDEANLWISYAERDLKSAIFLQNMNPVPIEIICYHCEQCAEKALKGIIALKFNQSGIPKVHDLTFLLNQIKNVVEVNEKYYDYADRLTPYGIAIRYPNDLGLIESDMVLAIKYAQEIFLWAVAIIM